ncbi:ATP synthase subunit s-like protein [Plakobranchus ocellatus]|uniref:ATP synthase subunit s-like protein n=1 Tax=Plakobranchus ocellatus TaxID=259542 RepID=A0AAV4C7F7_9GAST|nr:ATP synthase subunit s-like protein [Plakobranchus ocellatus]
MAARGRGLQRMLDFSYSSHLHARARSIGFFSRSKKNDDKNTDQTKEDNKWGPQQENNTLTHGKDMEHKLFKDEPIPDHFMGYHLKDPVRNTEREYFQTHQNPNWEGHKKGLFDSRFYSKKYGISKEVYSWLHWDLNFNDNDEIQLWRRGLHFRMHKEDQRYLEDRVRILGHELAAAHFIVARGGAVKFVGRDHWFVKDANGNYSLPRKHVDNLYIEAIDVSNSNITHVAFDTLGYLQKIRFLKFRNCQYLDDWCLARLQQLKNSIEFLDFENCDGITDNGLSSLQCLSKLQVLRLCKLSGVKHKGLLTLHLEEHLPGLKVLGVTDEEMKPPAWEHRGESRLVRSLLGLFDEETDPDPFARAEEVPLENSGDDSYIYKRLIVKAD